jgi:RimJ/RimL family protein N-acetyltransferase
VAALRVEHVVGTDAARLRALRLEALSGDPAGFGSTIERDLARPPEFWMEWAAASEVGREQRTYVLVDDGADWRGLAMARIWPDEPEEAELLSMWVAPDIRGRRGAEMLCAACAAWTRERGVPTLVLAVFATNTRARRAYEKCDFTLDGDDTGDLLRMVRATR